MTMPKLTLGDLEAMAMNHDELQGLCLRLAQSMGLHAHHCNMRMSQPGLPDLVIIGPNGVLWREVKIPPDVLRPAQARLKWDLLASGQNYDIWTPADWESRRIQKELEEL